MIKSILIFDASGTAGTVELKQLSAPFYCRFALTDNEVKRNGGGKKFNENVIEM